MVPPGGRNRAPLSRELSDEAYRFDFFQAVRVLERMAVETPSVEGAPPRKPVGYDDSPRDEAVRFRALVSRTFPTGSVVAVSEPGATPPAPTEMLVAFMGLTGPGGALPQHYTTLLIERGRLRDFALRDFLDLFNHRIISLFYRAWEKYRFPVAYERATRAGEEDLFTGCLFSLVGLGTAGLRDRLEFDDEAFLYYAGLFAHQPPCAASLGQILADYFELRVDVLQFLGQWLYLTEEDQSSLPSPKCPAGLNTRLGTDVVVGERTWDIEGKFRVRLGPIGYAQFRRLTPSGDALRPLCQMIRSYVGAQFDFDIQPVLKGPEVPWCRLGGDGSDPSCLGWNTWIRSGELDRDVSDAVFAQEGLPWTKST
ncbi:MAG: type VI secretion system baseplate subunit TssG [Planctomycetia bacterium]|nr:type VI secretion system baseplate subunit TssG [Planctomycetia bacterium]